MKKHLKTLFFALLTLALASCATDEQLGEQPDTPPAGGKRMISLNFQSATTYGAVSNYEKRVITLAVFVETDNGEFHKFLSTEPNGSQYGFENTDVVPSSRRIDNATFALPADRTITKAVVAANYVNSVSAGPIDIANKLRAVTSMVELANVTMPSYPNAAHNYFDGLAASQVLTTTQIASLNQTGQLNVELKHISARVTPTLYAKVLYEDGTVQILENISMSLIDKGCFYIDRLMIGNPKSEAYLFPDLATPAAKAAIPQTEYFNIPGWEYLTEPDFFFSEMTGSDPNPLTFYLVYGYRPNSNEAWVMDIASLVIDSDKRPGHTILTPNAGYGHPVTGKKLFFPVTISIPEATRSEWEYNAWVNDGRDPVAGE